MLDGNIAMVVIGVAIWSYFFPIPRKDPSAVLIAYLRRGAVFCSAEHRRAEMIPAVATVLALVPIVGIAVFGWFWLVGRNLWRRLGT